MKVSEFVDKYITKGESQKKGFINDIIKDDIYIPYIEKVELASRVATSSMTNPETKMLQLNTPAKFILSTMSLIYMLTDLEPSDENNVGNIYLDYDLLNKNYLIEELISIPEVEKEYKEFSTILAMVCDDLIQNKYESHVFATELVGMVANALTKVLEPLSPTLDKLVNMSEDDAEKFANKINKVVDKITK